MAQHDLVIFEVNAGGFFNQVSIPYANGNVLIFGAGGIQSASPNALWLLKTASYAANNGEKIIAHTNSGSNFTAVSVSDGVSFTVQTKGVTCTINSIVGLQAGQQCTAVYANGGWTYSVGLPVGLNGIVKCDGAGSYLPATPNTDFLQPTGALGAIQAAEVVSPCGDATYTVGIGGTQNGTITTKGGFITSVQQAI